MTPQKYKKTYGKIELDVGPYGSFTISYSHNDFVQERIQANGDNDEDLRGLHFMLSEAIRLGVTK